MNATPVETRNKPPVVWTIAGTDPGSGAGIQADLKTFHGLGVYGCSVITAVLAQNTQGVRRVDYTDPEMVRAQLAVLEEDFPPAAVKTGMLGNAAAMREVASVLRRLAVPVVCDPVLRSTSGTDLVAPEALAVFRREILPQVDVLTPNRPEAEALTGRPVVSPEDVVAAADALLAQGCRSVLIKGGHAGGGLVQDYWTNGLIAGWLTTGRIDTTHTHGTGCTLASALAAARARGEDELDAVVVARAYVHQALRLAPGLGGGNGPVHHGGWPADPVDLPWLTTAAADGAASWSFPDCRPLPLGLYPVVDRLDWVQRLLACGVRTLQLRIKRALDRQVEEEIRQAVVLARAAGARCFINDHWQPALACGAYGVHLGQDDLDESALRAVEAAGCRLGLSVHSHAELARAWAYRPSYIAIGTVYSSPSKTMTYAPLGPARFAALRALTPCPAVAIGGLTPQRAPELVAAGADGIAVISDIVQAADPAAAVRAWAPVFG